MLTLLLILKNSALQFAYLFAPFLLAAALLTFPSRWMSNAFRKFMFPKLGLYTFGIIGIPVHEFAHALFCKIFFHKLAAVKWFDGKAKNGAHGFVTHHYDPWNPYHRVGHFFIGLAPAILGPLLLAALFYVCIPIGRPLLLDGAGADNWAHLAAGILRALVNRETLSSPGFYIFVYLSLAISSQIELSREDLKQTLAGIVPITLCLVAVNVFAWSLSVPWHAHVIAFADRIFSAMTGILTLATLLALINLIFISLAINLTHRISGREMVNPFRA